MWPQKKKATPVNKYEMAVKKAIDNFMLAVGKNDSSDAIKKLGVLEYFRVPDIDYFTGLTHQLCNRNCEAAACFEKVAESSQYYQLAQIRLATIYSVLGDYEKLVPVIENPISKMSPAQKLECRLRCVTKLDASKIPILLQQYAPSSFEKTTKRCFADEPERIYWICRLFSDALVVAGEIINQAKGFQDSLGQPIDWKTNPDFSKLSTEYTRFTYILSHSVCLHFIQMSEGNDSLANAALAGKEWAEKIRIFKDPNYSVQIMQMIANLCNPQIHVQIPAYTIVEHMLDQFNRINPSAIAQVINQYFSIVEDAYKAGNESAAQYLGYVKAEIVVSGKDSFNLEAKIDQIIQKDPRVETIIQNIQTYRFLSPKAYEALISAEMMFSRMSEKNCGVRDCSTLALQFFRVFEIELKNKLIQPLLLKVDIGRLHLLNTQELQNSNGKKYAQKNHDDLKFTIDALDKAKNVSINTLEIGKIQTMLFLTTRYYLRQNACAQQLHSDIAQCLSSAGKMAYDQDLIQGLIAKTQRDKYRNPGAHTGYLPYSIAEEAREYVLSNLPILESWF